MNESMEMDPIKKLYSFVVDVIFTWVGYYDTSCVNQMINLVNDLKFSRNFEYK